MKREDNILGKKLARIRKAKGFTQDDVSDMLGVKRQTYSAYERGLSSPDSPVLAKIARLFGVTTDSILYDDLDVNDYRNHVPHIRIPVYGSIAAGVPIEAAEDIEDYEEVELSLSGGGELIALRIKGKSMEPKFSEGDAVIVRLQDDVDNNDIAVVIVDGSDAAVKKVKKYSSGISLISLNPAYEPMFFSNEEIETLPVRILGRVIELRAKF